MFKTKPYPEKEIQEFEKKTYLELRKVKFSKKQADWILKNLVDYSFLWR